MAFELYFTDLTDEAQKELLNLAGITDPKELNWDVYPITEFAMVGVDIL